MQCNTNVGVTRNSSYADDEVIKYLLDMRGFDLMCDEVSIFDGTFEELKVLLTKALEKMIDIYHPFTFIEHLQTSPAFLYEKTARIFSNHTPAEIKIYILKCFLRSKKITLEEGELAIRKSNDLCFLNEEVLKEINKAVSKQ